MQSSTRSVWRVFEEKNVRPEEKQKISITREKKEEEYDGLEEEEEQQQSQQHHRQQQDR